LGKEWRSRELKGGGGGRVRRGRWRGGEVEAWGGGAGPALVPEQEEQQGYEGGKEESKSQLERVLGFFFLLVFFSFL
jgi:hypothetical protein